MKNVLLFLLTVYQKIISPLLHNLLGIKNACRSYPTCSDYAKEAVMKYGAAKGALLSMRKVINCQPLFSL